ncbi:hypothetical protein BCR36DRAFT_344696 [Piromyces finnis]|uniref:Uncharacterized protein n=1 Tax=Piromyces finnis TaxID=1754191 RepID=A0A1Y1VJI7_9FUNG|nr:hypothetical protein BCR36DRAFT_344696 [Piromyces finnis]|eukprot:ORX57882.1 hypothetical protein BCR36DRAFT_344696 [Piromyces finnis]
MKNIIFNLLSVFLLIIELVYAIEENYDDNNANTTTIIEVSSTINDLTPTETVDATESVEVAAKNITSEDNPDEVNNFDNMTHISISSVYKSVVTNHMKAEIHCLYNREDQCEIFQDQLRDILSQFESVFVIKEDISLSLFLMDLTYMCKDCLGIVLPPSFVYLKEEGSDKVYTYPQALAKQLNFDGKEDIQFSSVDFTMVINVDQTDEDIRTFGEYILAREILHGIGIATTGDLVNSNGYPDLFNEDFYAPQRHPKIKVDDEQVDGVYVKFKKFYPLSIFERYIVRQSNPNDFIFNSLGDMYKVEFPPQDYYKFMNDTKGMDKIYLKESYDQFLYSSYYEPAKEIARLYKQKGSVGFKTSDNSVIPLQTFDGEYLKSLSINHIDIPKMKSYYYYEYDPFNKNEIKDYLNDDFILNYTYMFMYDLNTIKSIVNKDGKYGIFGSGTVKILTTLGWKLKHDKNNDDPTISANIKYQVATEVDIPYNNYYDELMRISDEHDYYGYGSLANNKMVCDIRTYTIALLAIGLTLGL